MRTSPLLFAALLAASALTPANAATWTCTVPVELQLDVIDSDIDGNGTDVFATIEPDVSVAFGESFALNLGLTLEPVADWAGSDRFLKDHGLYIRELNAQLSFGALTLQGGKISIPFASAYDVMPGVYGDAIIEDLEINERIGVKADWLIAKGESGSYTLTGAIYTSDTSFMSESAFTNRGRTIADGEAGNTGSLDSITLTFTAENAGGVEGLSVRTGFTRFNGDDGAFSEEINSFAIAIFGEFESAGGFVFVPVAEFVSSNGDGFLGEFSQRNLTLGIGVRPGPWEFAAAVKVQNRTADFLAQDDDLTSFELSAGYSFENGLGVSAGYIFARDHVVNIFDDETFETSVFGLKLEYE